MLPDFQIFCFKKAKMQHEMKNNFPIGIFVLTDILAFYIKMNGDKKLTYLVCTRVANQVFEPRGYPD